jgi:hypothetical protein
MKARIIFTFGILSLFATVIPFANADSYSRTVTTEELAPMTNTSMSVASAPITVASETPIYIESLKTDNIIEKNKHHRLISGLKHRQWL